MKIFVVGSGKLANAIIKSQILFQSVELLKWETQFLNNTEKSIIIHAGSGRQLKDCIDFCARTKSVLIELSTGLETEKMESDFPLIICPNTSILILKTLHMLKVCGSQFQNYSITLTESHQSTKKTEPGTAFAFAHYLQLPPDTINSVRNPEMQQNEIGIPKEYLDKHAYHKITIKDGNDEVTIETKVLGHESYAKGVKAIIEAVLKHTLENKKYTILDLIEKGLL